MATRVHPVVVTAAISVIMLSAVGVGVMTGSIPSSFSKHDPIAANENRGAAPEDNATAEIRAAENKVLDPTKSETAKREQTNAAQRKVAAPAKTAEPRKVAAAESAPTSAKLCETCGTVTAVEEVKEQGEGTGVGAVGGGVAGAVIGNQIGDGTTRKIATIAGAAAGAYGGHQAEKYIRSTSRYDVTVRMDDGTYRTISEKTDPALRPGDEVKVENGALVRN